MDKLLIGIEIMEFKRWWRRTWQCIWKK